MAMNAATLATQIKADWVAQGAVLNDFNSAFIDMLCTRILAHIQSQAVVNVASVSGVTTGTGVSGPGLGTIS